LVFLELGISSCRYLGEVDNHNEVCHKDAVKVDKLPPECTALLYNGLTCNELFEIAPSRLDSDIGNKLLSIHLTIII